MPNKESFRGGGGGYQPYSVIKNICSKWKEVQSLVEKHPNKTVASCDKHV